jgi:putative transposase
VGPNPTDRGKRGVKKSVLVDRDGGPLAVVIAAANVPDYQLLARTLDAIAPIRPAATAGVPHELYGDRGYDHAACDAAAAVRGYTARIARKGGGWARVDAPPPSPPPQCRRRRWLVERTLAWLSKCRGLLVRYEKKASNYLGFVQVACILLWYRRAKRQSG